MAKDYPGAFTALRQILARHGEGMVVMADTPTVYTLVTEALGPNRKALWFGCVTSKKSAVTYHLVPLYYNPKLLATVTPELEARRAGKTCFHFQRPEPELFEQLDVLTGLGREQWLEAGFLEPGPVPAERFAAALRAAGVDPAAVAARRREVLDRAASRRTATARGAQRIVSPRKKRRAVTAGRSSHSSRT